VTAARHRRHYMLLIAVAGAVCVAAAITYIVLGRAGAKPVARASANRAATDAVTRSDMVERQKVDGTLGFAGSYTIAAPAAGAVSPGLGAGIVTWLPLPGQTIARGKPVYRIDDRPVTLFYGSVPFWRELSSGVADGVDVRELKRNLKALGYGPDLADDAHFTWATGEAVRKWQKARGLAETGTVSVGEVVVEPAAIRVTTLAATIGAPPTSTILTATGTTRVVNVDMSATNVSLAKQGASVSIQLPGGATTTGRVTDIGTVATAPAAPGDPGSAQPGSGTDKATIAVTVSLDKPAEAGKLDGAPVTVLFTSSVHKGVLSVPVTALLATVQGEYAVQVLAPDGAARLVPVTLGTFADGRVEVSSPDLREGTKVAVAPS